MLKIIFPFLLSIFILLPLTAQIIYVNPTTTNGNNDGTSWSNPYLDLQTALDVANVGDTVYIATGEYYPTTTDDRYARIIIPANITLIGGFKGVDVFPQLVDNYPEQTVLSGDIGTKNDATDNSFTVASALLDPTDTLRIKQIYIEGGNANSEVAVDGAIDFPKSGGGLFIKQSDSYGNLPPAVLEIENVYFRDNIASRNGGAMLVQRGVILDLDKVHFINNEAYSGGGLYKACREREGDVHSFRDLVGIDNMAGFGQGSVLHLISEDDEDYEISGDFNNNIEMPLRLDNIDGNTDYILNVHLSNNRTLNLNGGETSGIRIHSTSTGTGTFLLEDSTFGGQATTCFSDALGSDNMDIQINRCVFASNHIGPNNYIVEFFSRFTVTNSLFLENSGGLLNVYPSSSGGLLENCTFLENSSLEFGGIHLLSMNQAASLVTIRNSIIRDLQFESLPHAGNLMRIGAGTLSLENNLIYPMTCEQLREDVSNTEEGEINCQDNIFAEPVFIEGRSFILANCSSGVNAAAMPLRAPVELYESAFNNIQRDNNGVDIGALENPQSDIIAEYQGVEPSTCAGNFDAQVNFSFNNENTSISWQNEYNETGNTLDSLRAGQYQFFFENGMCRERFIVNIPAGNGIDATLQTNDISCYQQQDGQISIQTQNGTAPFLYQWDNGLNVATASNLPAGDYTITVTDSSDCSAVVTAVLNEPQPIDVHGAINNATNSDIDNGSILITEITGGTPPYQIEWNTGSTDSLIQNLSIDNYIVTVTDANGCTYSEGFAVSVMVATEDVSAATRAVSLSPNPASNQSNIVIKSDLRIENVVVFATSGEQVNHYIFDQHFISFDTRGIFFIKIILANGDVVWRKVLVQ